MIGDLESRDSKGIASVSTCHMRCRRIRVGSLTVASRRGCQRQNGGGAVGRNVNSPRLRCHATNKLPCNHRCNAPHCKHLSRTMTTYPRSVHFGGMLRPLSRALLAQYAPAASFPNQTALVGEMLSRARPASGLGCIGLGSISSRWVHDADLGQRRIAWLLTLEVGPMVMTQAWFKLFGRRGGPVGDTLRLSGRCRLA